LRRTQLRRSAKLQTTADKCKAPAQPGRSDASCADEAGDEPAGTAGAFDRRTVMRIFLDFEASSLSDDSYPIEVGWAAEDGSFESHLIHPAPAWTDWDECAEAMHGISRARLLAEGEPHETVAHRALQALQPHDVFVTAPSWDGKWMSLLLRSAGLPRHALRLKNAGAAHCAAVAEMLGEGADAAPFIQQARRSAQVASSRHRALADAQAELAVWREVRRLADLAR
jgi:hypothetical protein